MTKKVSHIPTLQEYVRKRKKLRAEWSELKSCIDCDYYRKDLDVCLWGDTVKIVSTLSACPITYRDL
ncbi:MAG: hypothetical protein V2B14_04005 [bacterium]